MTMVPVENVAGRPQSMTSTRSLAGVAISDVTPLVFVVNDNVSVRESLELLIMSAGWQPRTFASAQDFPSDRSLAASQVRLNQGWCARRAMNCCPTMPVAPRTPTSIFPVFSGFVDMPSKIV